jgi:hypothetical protein
LAAALFRAAAARAFSLSAREMGCAIVGVVMGLAEVFLGLAADRLAGILAPGFRGGAGLRAAVLAADFRGAGRLPAGFRAGAARRAVGLGGAGRLAAGLFVAGLAAARADFLRREAAAARAWRERAPRDTVLRGSFSRTPVTARDIRGRRFGVRSRWPTS